MVKLRAVSDEGYAQLMEKDGKFWSRAFFQSHSKCDSVDNNMSETFNSWILKPRCKAPISMIREIIEMCTERRRDKKFSASRWPTDVSPRARDRLKLHMDLSHACGVLWPGETDFQIYDGLQSFTHVVNFQERTCTCRVWQSTGVPCPHALRAINYQEWNPDDFIDVSLKREKYLAAYGQPLECSRGEEVWRQFDGEKLLPPIIKSIPGRPKKNRRKARFEPKKIKKGKKNIISKKGTIVIHCKICGGEGHNMKGCPVRNKEEYAQFVKESQGTSSTMSSFTNAKKAKRKRGNSETEQRAKNQC
ncbi:hypothetical protein SLEP1_g49271 [Rubroshorea leprosula]|uniref:SWIM-type domain-containing protein n=1 Tax=Rubroshorea leprosula TaxID=152421 RepID=A0AAV5LWA5_9ROSI|nr:hypothetical protein SLEP1_g49271 [Rubroshorea leprosula]